MDGLGDDKGRICKLGMTRIGFAGRVADSEREMIS